MTKCEIDYISLFIFNCFTSNAYLSIFNCLTSNINLFNFNYLTSNKSMTQSLPSRSSQDEFSKSKVPDKNTKEHLKNKVNQKDLTSIKNISATSLKLKTSAQKVLGKQKNQSVKTEAIPFIPKQYVHPRDIFLYRNKALSDISGTELYCLIIKVYKPPKHFDFPETERSFRFVWLKSFHRYVTLSGRMVSIAFLAFYLAIKLWEVLVWKIFTKNHIKHG